MQGGLYGVESQVTLQLKAFEVFICITGHGIVMPHQLLKFMVIEANTV